LTSLAHLKINVPSQNHGIPSIDLVYIFAISEGALNIFSFDGILKVHRCDWFQYTYDFRSGALQPLYYKEYLCSSPDTTPLHPGHLTFCCLLGAMVILLCTCYFCQSTLPTFTSMEFPPIIISNSPGSHTYSRS